MKNPSYARLSTSHSTILFRPARSVHWKRAPAYRHAVRRPHEFSVFDAGPRRRYGAALPERLHLPSLAVRNKGHGAVEVGAQDNAARLPQARQRLR